MDKLIRPHSSLSYLAPFGQWPNDCKWEEVAHTTVILDVNARVHRCPTAGVVVKHFSTGNCDKTNDERILSIMRLAGDCCVAVVGRMFCEGYPSGICMPIEKPIEPASIARKDDRVRLIYQLRDLIGQLHAKNIVHGDLKPQNLLMCSDGRLRLPFRMRGHECVPMTRAEDIYALGLTIWELYTGRTPLLYGDETLEEMGWILENRARVGMLPDMKLIDDCEIYTLIEACLAAAPECPNEYWEDDVFCVETRLEFGRCHAEPRHIHSRIVHRPHCRTHEGAPCEFPYVDRKYSDNAGTL
ncbi:kinase-like domain-containing protein [Mycena crocata]|nr:kinase-like domain-containing protein [Mycena crocata]